MQQTGMFKNSQKENSLSLQPKLLVILLEYFFAKDMGVGAFLFSELPCFRKHFNKVTLKLFYLL
jgi:hypothetical protein